MKTDFVLAVRHVLKPNQIASNESHVGDAVRGGAFSLTPAAVATNAVFHTGRVDTRLALQRDFRSSAGTCLTPCTGTSSYTQVCVNA